MLNTNYKNAQNSQFKSLYSYLKCQNAIKDWHFILKLLICLFVKILFLYHILFIIIMSFQVRNLALDCYVVAHPAPSNFPIMLELQTD